MMDEFHITKLNIIVLLFVRYFNNMTYDCIVCSPWNLQ